MHGGWEWEWEWEGHINGKCWERRIGDGNGRKGEAGIALHHIALHHITSHIYICTNIPRGFPTDIISRVSSTSKYTFPLTRTLACSSSSLSISFETIADICTKHTVREESRKRNMQREREREIKQENCSER